MSLAGKSRSISASTDSNTDPNVHATSPSGRRRGIRVLVLMATCLTVGWGLWQIPDVRIGVLWGSFRVFGLSAVPWFIRTLGDSQPTVRRAAAKALGQVSTVAEPAIPLLISRLGDEDPGCRMELAETLGLIGSPAVDPLLNALNDKQPVVRQAAASALGRISDETARIVPALIRQLSDENADCRTESAAALGRIGDPAVEPLLVVLAGTDPHARAAAALALAWVGKAAVQGARKTTTLLAEALTDSEMEVRRGAADALCRLSPACKDVIRPMAAALADADREVRRSVAEALFKLDQAAAPAFEDLVKAARNDDFQVRLWSVRAVGALFDTSRPTIDDGFPIDKKFAWSRHTYRISQLLQGLSSSDPTADVRKAAREALYRVDRLASILSDGGLSSDGKYNGRFSSCDRH